MFSGLKVAIRPASVPEAVWARVADATRCATLAALSVMDTHKDEDFARVNRLAAALFSAPSSAIAVVDPERASLVSAVGIDLREIPVGHSFAAHVIAAEEPVLVVPDASRDERFRHSMLVEGAPGIRFYVGAPIVVHGQRIGALQVFSSEPRTGIDEEKLAQLRDLAGTAGALFELKHEARVRERTAAELIREEWRHALTLEAGKVGSWVWDFQTGSVAVNDIFRRMYGLAPSGPVVAQDLLASINPDDRPGVDAALKAAFEDGVDYQSEFRIGGTGRWLVGRGRVYQRDAAGEPLVMMGVNLDITEAREAADHTQLLLRELNHRVKNTLAMIQSLARQTARQSPDPAQFIESFYGRLRTLSDAHALLSDGDWSGIGLTELIRSQVNPYVPDPAQIVLDGEDARLPPDQALGLGIILHELASNAARYGALSVPMGRVTVAWTIEPQPERRVLLVWAELGGPKVEAEVKRGFGAKLIERGLDKVLGSTVDLDFPANGARARISLPLG